MNSVFNTPVFDVIRGRHSCLCPENCVLETLTGSLTYGTNKDVSDIDLIGVFMNPVEELFPAVIPRVTGFAGAVKQFEAVHVDHIEGENGASYDFTVYGIVKFMTLLAACNPNIIDTLFVDPELRLSTTNVSDIIFNNQKLFLSKQVYASFTGYARHELHAISDGSKYTGKRKELVYRYGYDTKRAYHVVRLLHECSRLLETGSTDLQEISPLLIDIRRGEFALDDLMEMVINPYLAGNEELYAKSKLPQMNDMDKIHGCLLNCIEEFYGAVPKIVFKKVRK